LTWAGDHPRFFLGRRPSRPSLRSGPVAGRTEQNLRMDLRA
jgi:hypothetical protein